MNNDTSPIKSRRQAVALAGALTLTVLTGAGALFGLAHKSSATPVAAPAPTVVQPAAATQPVWHEGSDN